MTDSAEGHTFTARFRLPRRMWDAYGNVLGDRDRGADLLDHVRATIKQHGDEQALADLAAAEEELTARRARKGGRPRRGAPPAQD
ncbi:hypothetical protein [Streptomyces sp. x-80]|uniref:hypothetical protein n=1 Tax=Streptomyces sp. x-80 TaxID=2789282 RepID=UPI003980104D